MAKKKETEQAVAEEMAVTIPEEPAEVEEPKRTREEEVELHIANQLKAINRMSNKARARRLAQRVLNNRKGI